MECANILKCAGGGLNVHELALSRTHGYQGTKVRALISERKPFLVTWISQVKHVSRCHSGSCGLDPLV